MTIFTATNQYFFFIQIDFLIKFIIYKYIADIILIIYKNSYFNLYLCLVDSILW